MGKLTFIIGGARSGKSNLAAQMAKEENKRVVFIATAQVLDEEMERRVQLHKKERPHYWRTIEEHKNLIPHLEKINSSFDIAIIDCLTLYISNLFLEKEDEHRIEDHINTLIQALKTAAFKTIIISNEVGLSIIPDNALARKFRDLAGKINQIAAKQSDEVFFMVSGLPLKLK